MKVVSTYRFARVSPKKAIDVARAIQGLSTTAALDLLSYTPRKAAFFLQKVLKTAMADAKNNYDSSGDFFVKKALVNKGPSFRRFRPRARGSASPICKKTSHLSIVLEQTSSKSEN